MDKSFLINVKICITLILLLKNKLYSPKFYTTSDEILKINLLLDLYYLEYINYESPTQLLPALLFIVIFNRGVIRHNTTTLT